jgi:hypothetical protein
MIANATCQRNVVLVPIGHQMTHGFMTRRRMTPMCSVIVTKTDADNFKQRADQVKEVLRIQALIHHGK